MHDTSLLEQAADAEIFASRATTLGVLVGCSAHARAQHPANPPVTMQPESQHLTKSIRWWDGVAVTLSLPAALFVSLGYSIAALGAWAAIALWALAAALATLHNWIYSELGAMFVEKSGGIALYANEAWRSRIPAMGALATYSYWFAWATAPALWGLAAGQALAAQFWPGDTLLIGSWHLSLSSSIAVVVAFGAWSFSMIRLRFAMLLITFAGVLLMLPVAIFCLAPWIKGHAIVAEPVWHVGMGWAGLRVSLSWLFVMVWAAYCVEAAASFIPEFRDTVADTKRALRVAALIAF